MIGAILTQNTSWRNVELAINNLRKENYLEPERLYRISGMKLRRLLKPAGFYNIKAERVMSFVKYLWDEYKGDMESMKHQRTLFLREQMLGIKGIGLETCDSILLYALEKPVFVVDAYTRRILSRHKIIKQNDNYGDIQNIFEKGLKADVNLFNEYHALFVRLGKDKCKKGNPLCESCPLNKIL